MSSIFLLLLIAVCTTILLVQAAPLESSQPKPNASVESMKRRKRSIIIDEPQVSDDEMQLRQQLSELSDDQLAMLAEIVQSQIDRFVPDQQAYQVVELPEYITTPVEYMPRDRRSVYDVAPSEEEAIVVIPEETLIALEQQQIEQQQQQLEEDELELRQRISEIASILNERTSRAVRLI